MFSRGFNYSRYRGSRTTTTSYRRRGTIRSRSIGNTRSARSQRDSATVVINRITPVNVYVPAGSPSSPSYAGSVYLSHWDQLRLSQFYNNYSEMYDQMRLDRTRIKITGSSATANNNPYTSPTVILAFDRNGLYPSQFSEPFTVGDTPQFCPNPDLVSTYSSAQTRQWSSGNSFSIYQTVYPSTIQEKGQFISTQALTNPSSDFPSDDVPTVLPETAAVNPASVWSSMSVPYKPVTLLAVRLAEPTTAQNTYIFNVEFEFTVTFRGMRKPSVSGINSTVSDSLLLTPLSRSITTNGDYIYNPTDVSTSAQGFSSANIVVSVDPPAPDIQSHTITLTSYNFPQTFSINEEEPDAPDGWNPVIINANFPDIFPFSLTSMSLGSILNSSSTTVPMSSFQTFTAQWPNELLILAGRLQVYVLSIVRNSELYCYALHVFHNSTGTSKPAVLATIPSTLSSQGFSVLPTIHWVEFSNVIPDPAILYIYGVSSIGGTPTQLFSQPVSSADADNDLTQTALSSASFILRREQFSIPDFED